MVELNYCNNSKRKRKNGGKAERKEGKKRKNGGKGKGKKEIEKKDLGNKIINRVDESSGGCEGRFFVQSPEVCQKLVTSLPPTHTGARHVTSLPPAKVQCRL